LCQSDVGDPEAWFLLAGINAQLGAMEEVITCCRRVIELQPGNTQARYNLGVAFQTLGELDQAASVYRDVLATDPDNSLALANLALILYRQDRISDAETCCLKSLAINPNMVEARNTLGLALKDQGRIDEAVKCFKQILIFDPAYADALYNLGFCCIHLKQYAEAVEYFEQALRVRPGFAEASRGRGIALQRLGRPEEALASHRQAIIQKADFAEAYNNVGRILVEIGKPDEAVANFRKALTLKPNYAEAYSNLGNALVFLGRHRDALANYEEALRIQPHYARAHWNRSWVLLLEGDFEQGWMEYEWRWKCGISTPRTFSQPLWDGRDLHGKNILLHAEQGAGDTIQFIRYASLVKQRGGRVIVECRHELLRLFSSCADIDTLVAEGESLPGFEFHAPIPSLPGIFKTDMDSIPATVPYLRYPGPANAELNMRLDSAKDKFRIGIAWSGNVQFPFNYYRSCRLSDFGPIAELPGVSLFSLQKGIPAGELIHAKCNLPICDLGVILHDFADTAAAIEQLDLIITVDTSVAHLAGALGKPVWLLISAAPDWRWLTERMDSPWYPTMRLFRQPTLGDWQSVFIRVSELLKPVLSGTQTF
jgi:tetratricopeptide (TPR) repeat protein